MLAVAGATMGAHDQAKAEGAAIDAQNRQSIEQLKQMNYTDANLRLEERETAEQAMVDLTTTNLNGIRNQGMVRAAVSESGLEGASMDRIEREVEGDTIRERAGITENYKRDYAAIFGQRLSNIQNTKSAIDGKGAIIPTNPLAHALNVVNAGAGAYMASGGKFGQGSSPTQKAPIGAAKGTQPV